jgi:hypothetical protein
VAASATAISATSVATASAAITASASASAAAATTTTTTTTTTIFGVCAGMGDRIGDQDGGCRQHPTDGKRQDCLFESHNYLHLLVLVINRKQSRCKTKAIAPGQSTLQHISRQRRQQRMAPRDRVRTGTVRSGGWIIQCRTVFLG